jgi:hypothetical protein
VAEQSYEQLPGFEGYYLEDSFVLGLKVTPEALEFDLLAVVTPVHPEHTTPQPGEQHPYRPARIRFDGLRRLTFLGERTIVPAVDAAGDRDLGNIDALVAAGDSYRISGDWGVIEIESSTPTIGPIGDA